jgi:hypothetical protein
MDFDNEEQAQDQVFEDNGIKIVTDLKVSCICLIRPYSLVVACLEKAFTLRIPML